QFAAHRLASLLRITLDASQSLTDITPHTAGRNPQCNVGVREFSHFETSYDADRLRSRRLWDTTSEPASASSARFAARRSLIDINVPCVGTVAGSTGGFSLTNASAESGLEYLM